MKHHLLRDDFRILDSTSHGNSGLWKWPHSLPVPIALDSSLRFQIPPTGPAAFCHTSIVFLPKLSDHAEALSREERALWAHWQQQEQSKEDIQMANKHMKRFSTLLIIKEMQIKTIMTYHLTLVRMAIIRKSLNNKCCRGCEKKGTLLHCWWECKLIQPLWRTVRRFLKILGIKSPYDPPIPLLGLYPKEIKTEKVTCTPMFIAALLQ